MAQDKYFGVDQGACDITALTDEAFGASYLVAKIAADGDVGVGDAGTDAIIGVCQEKAANATRATIRVQGVSLCRIASGSINAGIRVTATTGGYVAEATDGQFVLGITLATATGVDSVVPVLLLPGCPQIEDIK
jgi:hypothetical protein